MTLINSRPAVRSSDSDSSFPIFPSESPRYGIPQGEVLHTILLGKIGASEEFGGIRAHFSVEHWNVPMIFERKTWF